MADLNNFQRSKERITEILNYLTFTGNNQANPYVKKLEQSIQLIDAKMEELKKQQPAKN